MSFIHYNARSLGANISKVRESLQRFSLTFDIVAISETWTKVNYLHYQLPNYSLFYTDRSLKQGGGVALYVSNKFNYNKIENMSYENVGFFEIITVELVIQNHRNIVFGCYRAPQPDTSVFFKDLDLKFKNVCYRKNVFYWAILILIF